MASSGLRVPQRPGTVCRSYPPQNRNDLDIFPRRAHVFEDFRHTIEADFDSTFDRMERQMERAMERMERMERRGLADGSSRQYRREWSNEGSSGREFFHESIVVSRPAQPKQGSHIGGYIGVLVATVAAVAYVKKVGEFRDVAGESVYRGEHLTRLSMIAPLLALVSSKFRDEWTRAARKKDAKDASIDKIREETMTDSLTDV